jgi:fatty acid desaturase
MRWLAGKFWQHDGPTLLVALVIYASWYLLIRYNPLLPWWVILPVGAYLIAWQFSLQHEAIHSFRGVPSWLRFMIVFPPLGLWFPYPLYRQSHSIHHRDNNLTDPDLDTESYYVRRATWQRMGKVRRAVLLVNQTLLGRLTIGPLLRVSKLISRETRRIARRDLSHVSAWLIHIPAIAALLWVCEYYGMPWWKYVLLIAYPGMSLGLLRAFIEHHAAPDPNGRTASVESNTLFGLLFLYNNLHIAHHLQPTMPWYRIRGHYRSNRATLLQLNDHFVFRGYAEIARRWLVRPVFHPVHPTL